MAWLQNLFTLVWGWVMLSVQRGLIDKSVYRTYLILGFLSFNHWGLGLFPNAEKPLVHQLKGKIHSDLRSLLITKCDLDAFSSFSMKRKGYMEILSEKRTEFIEAKNLSQAQSKVSNRKKWSKIPRVGKITESTGLSLFYPGCWFPSLLFFKIQKKSVSLSLSNYR